jgi:hypothetical protein
MPLKAIDSLDNLMGGAAKQRFRDALDQVLKNAIDPNTNVKTKRQITITLSVTPDAERKTIGLHFDVKHKLAAPEAISKTCLLERDDKGRVMAFESADQLAGQVDIEDVAQPAMTGATGANVLRFAGQK